MEAEVSLQNLCFSLNGKQSTVSNDTSEMLEGVRRGDADAEVRFARIYSDGIRFYLRRHFGSFDLDNRMRSVLLTMMDRVRQGWTPQPGDLSAFLAENTRTWARLRGDGPSHVEVLEKAASLKSALKGCSKRELEMLIRYYVNGQSVEQVAEVMAADPEELGLLKWRLRRMVASETLPRPSASQAQAGAP